MKKHIFGFTIFSLIIASFVLAYTFLYAPSIPPKESVNPPVAPTEIFVERRNTCNPRKSMDFSYTVESSNYLAKQGKLISKINLHWNYIGDAPKKISVQPRLFTSDNYEKSIALNEETFINPFKEGGSNVIFIESKFILNGAGSGKPNFYIAFDVFDNSKGSYRVNENNNSAKPFPVLFVYDDPAIPKKAILKGTTAPQ